MANDNQIENIHDEMEFDELLAAAKAVYQAVHGDTIAVGPLWGRLHAAIKSAEEFRMILFFTLISIIAAVLGLYYLLGTEWKDMNEYRRADAVNACTLLAVIGTLAAVAAFVGPFR